MQRRLKGGDARVVVVEAAIGDLGHEPFCTVVDRGRARGAQHARVAKESNILGTAVAKEGTLAAVAAGCVIVVANNHITYSSM